MQKTELNGNIMLLAQALQGLFEESRIANANDQKRFREEIREELKNSQKEARNDMENFRKDIRRCVAPSQQQAESEHHITRRNMQDQIAEVQKLIAQGNRGIKELQSRVKPSEARRSEVPANAGSS